MASVGLIFGGRSVEHKVSVTSARTVAAGLVEAGHRVVPLGIGADGGWVENEVAARALHGELDALPATGQTPLSSFDRFVRAAPEVLFPIVHGTWGEDGSLQGLCEMLDLPYVGTGVASSAVAMDKLLAKRQLAAAGLPVVDGEAVSRADLERSPDASLERLDRLGLPIFVKPATGGSSVGVSKVADRGCRRTALEHALRFDDRVVVEKSVAGRELECAVLGYRELQASEIGEIVPGNDFYDYADKYLDDGAQLIAPAELPVDLAARLREMAIAAVEALAGWGMARVDFLVEHEGEAVFINEVNTLPGFTAISMYPRLWELSGVPLPDLVDRLVRIAQERHADRRRLDRGIREWIAELDARGGAER